MTATYDSIATTTTNGTTGTITFSSIPNTYTDLVVVLFCLTAGFDTHIRFNGDTGTNYSATILRGNGTAASSTRTTNAAQIFLNFNASSPALFIVDVFSYAGSTNKTILINSNEDANGSGTVERRVGLWRNTAAINSITLTHGGNFSSGTVATLYGIKAE